MGGGDTTIGDRGAPADDASDSGIGDAGILVDDAGCPVGRGPKMVSIPAPDGGRYCIDSTEVTNAHYAAFLAAKGNDSSGQPSDCSQNSTFGLGAPTTPEGGLPSDPCRYDPVLRANYPVGCVNWCDARAFCAWSGKQLCTAGNVPFPPVDQWFRACTSAGEYASLYGATPIVGNCFTNPNSYEGGTYPVGSLASCQSPDPQFSGVFDLLGNVGEWVATCVSGDGAAETQCLWLGGTVAERPNNCGANGPLEQGGFVSPYDQFAYVGFRCCSPL